MIIADQLRPYFEKRYAEEADNFSIFAEIYISLILINSKYNKNKIKVNEYFDKLIYLYPFFEGNKEMASIIKK